MTPKRKPENPEVDWGTVLESVTSSASGPFFFVKATRTKIRLVCLDEDIRNFFCLTTTFFRGKPKEKFIVFAIILGSDKGELHDKWVDNIVPVVITKTALQGIISLLADGYDLFSEENGHGITIVRSGKGTDTSYNVLPSPQPVPISIQEYEMPEMSLVEYAEKLSARQAAKGSSEDEGDW